MALLSAENLSKTYGQDGVAVAALKEANLSFDEGEIVALMGPSGSGKTTLLTILGAMNPPTTGRLVVDGIDVYRLSAEKRADFRHEYLGFVFQELQLISYLTAIENVMLPLAISGRGRHEQEEMARQALERIGLGDKTKRLPNQLSGGEQGRVAIARALVNHPPIILADEPTGALDTHTGEEVMKVLQGLARDGLTVVVVTHNPDNERFVDHTIRIRDGRIVAEEAPVTAR